MRVFRPLIALGLLLGTIGGAWWWTRPAPINLLVITLDTTRADRLGAWGGPAGLTPVLDELAASGTVFDRAYAPIPLTLPSHASLMTGLYPPEHGLRLHNGASRLGSEIPVLAEILQQRGFQTGAFIGAFVLDRRFGLDRGFERYDDDMGHAHAHQQHPGEPHDHRTRDGAQVVDSALDWLKNRRRAPFFCWVHLFDPHTPYRAREELFGDRYRDRPYDAGIAYADRQIGRLLEHLRQHGLDEHTLVVVAGDHGESLGEHQERTHGFTLYEATQHVPLILKLPGALTPVSPSLARPHVNAQVSLVDVFPTLLEALEPTASVACSGRSLLAACRGEDLSLAPVYAETDHPVEEGGWAGLRGIMTERWKYIRSPRPELYDLTADPHELDNLATTQPEQMQELETALQEFEQRFEPREAPTLAVSAGDRRKLASLGYVGGVEAPGSEPTADIKDMLPHYNIYSDAQGLMTVGDFKQAGEMLDGVVRAAPNFFQAWFNLGVCRQQQGRLTEAEAAFARCVEIDGNPWARIALCKVYLIQNETQKAIPQLESTVRVQPDSVEGWCLLGDAFRMQGNRDKAREHYRRALTLDPRFPPAQQGMHTLDQQRQ